MKLAFLTNWNVYTNTGNGGDEADIYPASFIAIFGLYLFLPLLVDYNTLKNTFAEDTSNILPEIYDMYRVYRLNNGLYISSVSTLLVYLVKHAYDINLLFQARIESKLNKQILNSIMIWNELINNLKDKRPYNMYGRPTFPFHPITRFALSNTIKSVIKGKDKTITFFTQSLFPDNQDLKFRFIIDQ